MKMDMRRVLALGGRRKPVHPTRVSALVSQTAFHQPVEDTIERDSVQR